MNNLILYSSGHTHMYNCPPPIIAAFCLQRDRNEVLSRAKELKGSKISLKSDLPRKLNDLRNRMLTERKRLNAAGVKVRVVERSYLPVLQRFNVAQDKWNNLLIFDRKLPLDEALNPVMSHVELPVVEVEDGDVITPP